MKLPLKNAKSPLLKALRLGTTPLVIAGVFSLASNILYLALPVYMMQVYGRVLTSQSQATLWVLTFGAMAAFGVSAVIDHLRGGVLINYGVVFDERVSGAVFVTLFDAVVRGDAPARSQALRDLDTFRQTITGSGVAILFDLPWMPIFLGLLFLIDPIVGGLTVLGGLILLALAVLQDRATRTRLKEANNAALQSYAFTDTSLRNGEVVRALGMLPSLGRLWKVYRTETIQGSAAASEGASAYSTASKAVRMSVQILIIALGAYLVLQHKIGPAVLYANMILAARALAPIDRAVGSWNSLVVGFQAYDRLSSLLQNYEPSLPSTQLPRPSGALNVEGVSFSMSRTNQPLLLNNVSFNVAAGETLGVVGPSGAGKSTLARLLMGVWKPLGGSVRLDGADVFLWDRAAFGRYAGYLPQDVELFAGTVRDNIARFRADVADEAVIEAAMMAGAHQLILSLPKGYDTNLGEGGVVLSAGQRQRVGLARALFGDPALVVLDEPNAALDAEGENALMGAMESLKAKAATVVIVSHKPNVFRSADKMLLLRAGRVELFGPRDAVMARLVQPAASPPAIEPPSQAAAGAKA